MSALSCSRVGIQYPHSRGQVFGRQMGIAERHGRRRMPKEVAHRGERNAPHHEPASEGMAEVVEVEIGQASALTCPVKGVPYIIQPASCCIVKDPRNVLPGSKPAEQAPERFIER